MKENEKPFIDEVVKIEIIERETINITRHINFWENFINYTTASLFYFTVIFLPLQLSQYLMLRALLILSGIFYGFLIERTAIYLVRQNKLIRRK